MAEHILLIAELTSFQVSLQRKFLLRSDCRSQLWKELLIKCCVKAGYVYDSGSYPHRFM